MRKGRFPLLILAMSLIGCEGVPSAPLDRETFSEATPQPARFNAVTDPASDLSPMVVVFSENTPPDAEALIEAAGGRLIRSFPEVGIAVALVEDLSFAENLGGRHEVAAVGTVGEWTLPETKVVFSELETPTAEDWLYGWYQWDIRRVGADLAWAAGATGSHNTVVAIIDSGIDADHPDLKPNVVYQACMQLAGPCPIHTRINWHGTHVAGTIAATFGEGAAVGVGPNLGLASYQVFEANERAYDFLIWWAILDAANQGFEVVNMSLGSYQIFGQSFGSGAAVRRAWSRVVDYATRSGTTIVASAGNEGVGVNGTLFHIPGDLPGVINVGATGIQTYPRFPEEGSYDIQAYYSNSGAALTLSAPGGDCGEVGGCSGSPPSGYPWYWYLVASTFPVSDGGYGWMGGTSSAAPHVAGAAGLILDQNPNLNPRQVANILKRTADWIGPRQLFGHGMLDVLGAVQEASR